MPEPPSFDDVLNRACEEGSDFEATARLAGWFGALHDFDAASGEAAVSVLPELTRHLCADAIGAWLLTGLRLYPNDPGKRQRYFSLQDPRATEAISAEAGTTRLPAALASLNLLLDTLAGRRMQLQSQGFDSLSAAPQRPILTSTHLLLAADSTALDAPEPTQLFRASVAHAAAHLRYSPAGLAAGTLKPMSLAVISAVEDARVERLLMRECPGLREWFRPLLARALDPEGLSFSALISRMNYALIEPSYCDDNFWVNKARRLFEERANTLGNYEAFREIGSILANDLGQMRVRFHAQQYVVPAAYRDDNTYLWVYPNTEPPDETQELQTQSPVAAALVPRETQPADSPPWEEPETRRVVYPEWDYRLGLLRSSWCTVIERSSQSRALTSFASAPAALPALRLPALAGLTRNTRLRRQSEGEDLDLDAAIEHAIDRRRGHTPEHRVFTRPGRATRAISMLLLLDLSASSGDPIGERGRSILDLEKDAALLLARAAQAAGHRIAVHGFASDTRAAVNYYRLLDFGVPLDQTREAAIRAAVPRFSTRMGAALRHATTLLAAEPLERRAIIAITDGVPSDIDVFDAQYLVDDACVAAADARRAGIVTAGIAIDAGPADYMRRIVGRATCRSASQPQALPAQLSALYAQLAG